MKVLRFRVQGLGFRVLGSGRWVSGVGFEVAAGFECPSRELLGTICLHITDTLVLP